MAIRRVVTRIDLSFKRTSNARGWQRGPSLKNVVVSRSISIRRKDVQAVLPRGAFPAWRPAGDHLLSREDAGQDETTRDGLNNNFGHTFRRSSRSKMEIAFDAGSSNRG
ncbi:hypothetical protein [Luteolibacter sp.]|uniref:hypothetical protein n=1 Tax=Luteolibacter sp. TaxID=1962973 RepID=UPI003264C389